MRRIFKSRWFLLGLIPVLLLGALWIGLLGFSGSAHVNMATFRELKVGMTYDEVHALLGGRIHDVKPTTDSAGNPRMKYGYSEDHESVFPPSPTIWFTVDNDNRLTTKEYDTPNPKMIWDRLVLKVKVATGQANPPPPPIPPMPLPRIDRWRRFVEPGLLITSLQLENTTRMKERNHEMARSDQRRPEYLSRESLH